MEKNLHLENIIEIIKKDALSILSLSLFVGAIAAFVTALLLTPQYRATTQVVVNQSDQPEAYTNQDIQASLQLINTYSDIITSPAILDDVAENLDYVYSPAQLMDQTTVENENESQVITISVEDEIARNAEVIANEIVTVFQENIPDVMNVDNVTILTLADVGDNPSPVFPRPLLNIFIGLILGAIVGLGLAILRTFFDKELRTEEEFEKHLEVPVIGTVSRFNK